VVAFNVSDDDVAPFAKLPVQLVVRGDLNFAWHRGQLDEQLAGFA
jgi:hypothetical protein